MLARRLSVAVFLCASLAAPAFADAVRYRTPPPAIEAALNAPPVPVVVLGPRRGVLTIQTPLRYPPVADLARPMLRLAGLRIDPATNGIHHAPARTSVAFERVAGGRVVRAALPANARVTSLALSPDESRFALTNATSHGTELWLGATADGRAARVANLAVDDVFSGAVRWAPDGAHLIVRAVDRTGPPPAESVASGPAVQETSGKAGQIVTYEDMLANAHDEALFEYYATSRIALVDARTGAVARTAARGIYTAVSPSPDGRYVLAERVHRPFSYLFPYERFPTASEVLDLRGKRVATVADRPLADRVPADGVPAGPRDVAWKPSSPATLVWEEALDGGDPRVKAAARDKIVALAAPFTGPPAEVARTAARTLFVAWLDRDERALVNTYERATRTRTELLADARTPGAEPKPLWTLRDGDVYDDPGSAVLTGAPNGDLVVEHTGDAIWLRGAGYGPDGRRPFLDRLDVRTGEKTRVFRSELTPLEQVIAPLDPDAARIVTSRQSPSDPPNVFVRTRATGALRALTSFADPAPQLRAIGRRVVTYKRPDGVNLSFTLYTPPGWKEGTRLPTFVWAYPLEYVDRGTASQNTNTTQTFVSVGGPSPLFLALAGYAVLDNAAMPIVGDPATVNDTYVEQLVADAKAAVDEAVEIGVADPNRVAVGGHSYGAFMTANLLAHTRLFRAGIARSGAYNRTLTPFGFQNEKRSYWEATDLYTKMSPFTFANAIKDPLLLIHGMADDNTGTFPIQSERLYAAIQGNGGTARLVMLPYEAHGYVGRESVETTLAEMLDWLNRWVGPSRATAKSP
ncbi:MAG TPA: prolyl oligopeptidase family serine peptidase [Candidatus Elarobacter sp.]|nr:prolyl oligopeptidase family serine peptidase [Dongiaceae bacterium]HZW53155.1 prolyl oligopeptidase family serine peptidase [Candidatus Elarobacter sp.]